METSKDSADLAVNLYSTLQRFAISKTSRGIGLQNVKDRVCPINTIVACYQFSDDGMITTPSQRSFDRVHVANILSTIWYRQKRA